jgi:hypothetical protein
MVMNIRVAAVANGEIGILIGTYSMVSYMSHELHIVETKRTFLLSLASGPCHLLTPSGIGVGLLDAGFEPAFSKYSHVAINVTNVPGTTRKFRTVSKKVPMIRRSSPVEMDMAKHLTSASASGYCQFVISIKQRKPYICIRQ